MTRRNLNRFRSSSISKFPPGNSRRHGARQDLGYETLEPRQMLAATVTYNPGNQLLIIDGTNVADEVMISDAGFGFIDVEITGAATEQFDATLIEEITFDGGLGDDIITNNTSVPLRAFGHAGDDIITGGDSSDFVNGGPGNDIINLGDGGDEAYGHEGDDTINVGSGDDLVLGGLGNDIIDAGPGNDIVSGDFGNDTIYGGTGEDNLRGFTGNDTIYGGDGVDLMYGQYGDDLMYGDAGDDRVRGGPGMDELHGGDDDDYIQGEQDDDTHYGDAGNDTIIGFTGDDYLSGGDGNDLLYGQQDNDEMHGGLGDDILRGDVGNDIAYGNEGNDYSRLDSGDDQFFGGDGDDRVFGGSGDDLLYGGNGNDIMQGDADNDVLFGGAVEADTLTGGSGLDRFLARPSDTVTDQAAEDARLVFEDASAVWNDAEIENMDIAFAQLFNETGNNRLLQDSVPSGDLTILKESNLGGAAGINSLSWTTSSRFIDGQWVTTTEYTRQIQILDWDESQAWQNEGYQDVLIHEIGHNWDDDFEFAEVDPAMEHYFGDFLALSGWTDVDPQDPTNFTASADGEWWYSSSAEFEDDYGRTNPFEDMATVWEFYFSGETTSQSGFQAKLDLLAAIFGEL